MATIHGTGMSDVEIQQAVDDFGREPKPVRLLLASDIAAEGINLHFLSHKLVHFDIPWSFMTFQQRNGRVDRYGQERRPHIAYFYTEPRHERIRGDVRILELLVEKDARSAQNIGDPSIFLGVYDPHEEELKVGEAIEKGISAAELAHQMEQTGGDDLLAILFGDTPLPDGKEARSHCHSLPTLYPDDFAFVEDVQVFSGPCVGSVIRDRCSGFPPSGGGV